MPQFKIMKLQQLNSTTAHVTCWNICVEAQIIIFKSISASVPARHTHLEKKTSLLVLIVLVVFRQKLRALNIRDTGTIKGILPIKIKPVISLPFCSVFLVTDLLFKEPVGVFWNSSWTHCQFCIICVIFCLISPFCPIVLKLKIP